MSVVINIKDKILKAIYKIALIILTASIVSFSVMANKAGSGSGKKEFTLVIDPGHGGKDIGATDNGVREKDINLKVARELQGMLKKKMKDVKVVMTREDDTFISLQERANIANKNKGNLFISIHTNSVDAKNPNRKSVAGASVYALGLHKDQNNLQVARRENSVIELEKDFHQKYSGFDPSKDESYIIFEMAQKKNLGQSLKFANLAQKQLVATSNRKDRGVKQAGFWVLWATSMPAVLVELDFICNPDAAAYMNSDKGVKEMATALFNAVEQYVTNNSHKTSSSLIEIPDEQDRSTAEVARPIERKPKMDTPPVLSSSKVTASRRRRSLAAKEQSSERNVETKAIPLSREREYMVGELKPTQADTVQARPIENLDKDKSTKKKKADKRKHLAKNSKKSGNTVFLVSKDGKVTKNEPNIHADQL